VQFHAANFIGRDETRLNFRPVILTTPPDPNIPPPCVPSLEIIENATGQRRLLIPGVARMGIGG